MGYTSPDFPHGMAGPLMWFYAAACAMNVVAAFRAWKRRKWGGGVVWPIFAFVFYRCADMALLGCPIELSDGLKNAVDAVAGPVTFSLGTLVTLTVLYVGRRHFVHPAFVWSLFNVSLLLLGLSITDSQFASIVAKPDNVPIVAMVYLLAFFTWLATTKAVENDRRAAEGETPVEAKQSEKFFVWPDLVYPELICMVLVSAVLIAWSLTLTAPLEEPANAAVTPNPAKAPWYFLGLQELLVYADPWHAGVVVPCLIVLGLMAIPYLDVNRSGSGYYTIERRRFAYLTFQFGFLMLWILLILIGTFMRGPNWNFFGPYEVRDPHKIIEMANWSLSDLFWNRLLGRDAPEVVPNAGWLGRLATIAWREVLGFVLLAGYFLVLPPLLARSVFRRFRQAMGRGRYLLMMFLLLFMLTIPIKMILRWSFNISYLVSMPEYSFNF